MHCATKRSVVQLVQVCLRVLVLFSILVLAVAGRMPDSEAGWITCPSQVVMALRECYVQETPAAVVIFEFLERHWSTLVNGIESKLIPRTNNAVELVIRRFDQHYQNFCGFDTIETAQLFLGVFEKIYRFTPFSQACPEPVEGMLSPFLCLLFILCYNNRDFRSC